MDEARSVILVVMKAGAVLFALGLLLVFVGKWARRRHIAKHGEGSLPPREPHIWDSIPVRDRWILAAFVGGCLVLVLLLRGLR